MSKNEIRGYIILAVIFVVFSVIAFAIPFSITTVFWLAYVFGFISISYQIYVFKTAFSGNRDAKSRFYGFPIVRVGVIYLITQLIISVIEMILAELLPVWTTIIVNVILLVLAIVGCIATNVMRDEIVRQDVRLKKDVSNMRALQSMASALVGQCGNNELKKTIQNIADEFKYSDPVSNDQTRDLERELQNQLQEIQKTLFDEDVKSAKVLCTKVIDNLAERNRICALNK